MKKVYITGISGTGKTTLSKEFEKLGYFTLDIDTVAKWINNTTKERAGLVPDSIDFLNNHSWVIEEEKFNKVIESNLDKDIFFMFGIVDDNVLEKYVFDKIFLLTCSPETAFSRIENRTDNDFGKNQNEKDWILSWYKDFENDWIKNGAIEINTERPVNEVINEIIENLN